MHLLIADIVAAYTYVERNCLFLSISVAKVNPANMPFPYQRKSYKLSIHHLDMLHAPLSTDIKTIFKTSFLMKKELRTETERSVPIICAYLK